MARRHRPRRLAPHARQATPSPHRSRIPWLVGLAVAGAATALIVWLWPGAPVLARANGQNVLLVTIDTLRADALGSYGGRAATPALDRLAASGVRFDFAHAHAVVTLPAHASILTGVYPFEHGLRDNGGYRLPANRATLATALKAAGYSTAAFVSAFVLDAQYGLNAGFDVYDDRVLGGAAPTSISIPERRGDIVVNAARAWIDQQRGPWFAWVHLYDPHAPYTPPPPFDTQYSSNPYLGEVAWVDSTLAPLFDRLSGASPTTVVAVTGDHGEGLGDHGETTHGLFAYEATLRVPLILAQLGGTRARARGTVSPLPARHVDLVPTVLDLLNMSPDARLPGRSLLPALAGDDEAPRPSYFEAMSAALNRGWAPLTGVLVDREKYIELPIPELYNLNDDPGEQRNLVDSRDDQRRLLVGHLKNFGNTTPGARVAESAEVVARLRALGYVSVNAAPRDTRFTEEDDPKRLVEIDRAVHTGMDLIERGQLSAARDTYRGILEKQPRMALAYRHLAYADWAMGNADGAIATLKRAVASGIVEGELQVQLGTYLAEAGSPRDAILLLENLLDAGTASADKGAFQTDAADADAHNALGIAYAREGETSKALAAFAAALAIDPDNAMALQNQGAALLTAGRVDAAKSALERAVAADPTLASAWTVLGAAHLERGEADAALNAWREAIRLDPAEFDALYNLIIVLQQRGAVAEAQPLVERFVRTAPPARYAREIARIRGDGR